MLDSKLLFPPKRRWRMAFTVISFTRLLVSLSRKVLHKPNDLLRSLSYVAIQMNEENPCAQHVALIDIDQKKLGRMVKEKMYDTLNNMGGIMHVAVILQSDVKEGISGIEADLAQRKAVFGANRYKKPPAKSFLSFVLEAFKDTTIIILLVCAILSLSFGMKQHGPKDGWYDGGSIIIAIFLVVIVSAVSNFKQSRQFVKLSDECSDIQVQVVRDGRHQNISVFDVVVGDIVSLKIGDQIPADGLFLAGYSLKIDESSMTGESDHVEVNGSRNPFLLSGTKVTDGFGSMLVTSVGMNTAWGEMMSSISQNLNEQTPLQARLDKLTSYIGKVGLAVAALVLAVLTIRYFTGNTKDEYGRRVYNGSRTKVDDVLNSVVEIIAAAVTIVVVAIPEGLPLAVTLTLAYSMKKMMKDNALVRKLSACETMGSATTICTDKTGTLTLNQMKVADFWLGKDLIDDDNLMELEPNVSLLLQEAVALNATAIINNSQPGSVPDISGSPTEKAILSWAVLFGAEERMARIEEIRVMARSSPFDKLLMVQCLKEKGHVVAVTGDGTNDAPALKEADIGLSMGIQGTEVAKESSDIVILDDNFASVVTVLRWGRCVYNNIQKFIQFQLAVNIAALAINFISAISSGEVPLTAIQLLWVNLIMDTMGALALATEQPTNELMTKPPVGRSEPLITIIMWRNLIPQALYQVAILLILQFEGKAIFGVNERVKNTIIFNTFVLIILQVVMVELLKHFASTERLTWGQWGACILIAWVSWPIGFVVKCIPVGQAASKQRASGTFIVRSWKLE